MKDNQNEKKELEFKDFKNAISKDEFLAVLELAHEELGRMMKLNNARKRFEEKTKEARDQAMNNSNMPPGLAEKLLDGIERSADDKLLSEFSDEIKRHYSIIDFINRFRDKPLEYVFPKEILEK